MGKLHLIFPDRNINTSIKAKLLKSVIISSLEYAEELREEDHTVIEEMKAVQMKAAKMIL